MHFIITTTLLQNTKLIPEQFNFSFILLCQCFLCTLSERVLYGLQSGWREWKRHVRVDYMSLLNL